MTLFFRLFAVTLIVLAFILAFVPPVFAEGSTYSCADGIFILVEKDADTLVACDATGQTNDCVEYVREGRQLFCDTEAAAQNFTRCMVKPQPFEDGFATALIVGETREEAQVIAMRCSLIN